MASCFINESSQQFPVKVITLGDGGVHFKYKLLSWGACWEAPFSTIRKATPIWVSQLGCQSNQYCQKHQSLEAVSQNVSWDLKSPLWEEVFFQCLVPYCMAKNKKRLLWLLSKYLGDGVTQKVPLQGCAFFVTAKNLNWELWSRLPRSFRVLWCGTGLHVSPQHIYCNHPHYCKR